MAGTLRRLLGGLLVELGERVRGRQGNPGFLEDEYDHVEPTGEHLGGLEPIVSAKGRAMLERPRPVQRVEMIPPPLEGSLQARGFVRRIR